jgi:predicted phage terminase large subunit-like protein
VAAGRRFGKGILGISEAFKRGIGGQKCRWISPTYASDSYQAGWGIAENLARQIPGVDVHFQRRTFDFSRLGGAWLQFRTAEEPDSLRGEGIDFCVFDEAAHVPALQAIWEQCVRPSLMDRRGDAWWISTPKGFNFFNTLHNRGRDGEPGWASFHYTSFDNPFLDPAEIAALRKDMPALVARQEIDAEFVQLAGAMFKRQNIVVLEAEPSGVRWVRSWDLAFTSKTSSDYTAGARMGMTSDGTIVVADMVHGRWEWPEALRVISATAQLDGAAVRQGIECVGAQVGALQTLLREPMLATFAFEPIQVHNDKLSRALPLVARSEQGKLAIVRGGWNQAFVDQLCCFPEGNHDDMVDAVSGGLTLLSEPTGAIGERELAGIRIGRPDVYFHDTVHFNDPPLCL